MKSNKFTPVFNVFKKGRTSFDGKNNTEITICKLTDDKDFDIEAKKEFYKSLGYEILPIKRMG